nr:MAG TPA: hypothetical protein [Caudoviricetes sp.]
MLIGHSSFFVLIDFIVNDNSTRNNISTAEVLFFF